MLTGEMPCVWGLEAVAVARLGKSWHGLYVRNSAVIIGFPASRIEDEIVYMLKLTSHD